MGFCEMLVLVSGGYREKGVAVERGEASDSFLSL